jgi:D-methionine transport system substrate-binding protein
VNIWVARAEDADNPVYAELIDIYHRDEVIGQLLEENQGTAVEQDLSPEELQASLTELEDQVRAAG